MAYSNTNRDKRQVGWVKTLKRAVLTSGAVLVIISSLNNVYNQGMTLYQAKARNQEMERKIAKLEENNRKLEREIEYATSSASINRKMREYFGLGGGNDYWLILPDDGKNQTLIPEINESKNLPNIVRWWKLFTNP